MIFLRIIKSFGYAGRGLKQAWKDELNFRIEVITAVLILFLGWWLKLETIQMAVIVLSDATCVAIRPAGDR
jgi:diacylglycerol kinase